MSITINGTEHIIKCVDVEGAKWYSAKDVATLLSYKDTTHSTKIKVIIKNKRNRNN